MKLVPQLFAIFLCLSLAQAYIEEPGARFPATKGEIWPKPKTQIKNDRYFILKPNFKIKVEANNDCTILTAAVKRYESIISNTVQNIYVSTNDVKHKKVWLSDDNFLHSIDNLTVIYNGPACDDLVYPTDTLNEYYTINLSEGIKRLNSSSVWGILRGFESFYQSIYIADDYLSLRINKTFIDDGPRYSHRGLLLDTSRHFIPLKEILLTVEAMSQNKLNVFHWHIVDDQSFPYVSEKFPELSEKGAFSPKHIYTPADIKTVIEFARLRGIRVIPEFDTPGHTRSWGVSHPELLTLCEGSLSGKYGPINPTSDKVYDFINDLFSEAKDVFADKYIHLGGDEVEFECWQSNSNITFFMQQHKLKNYKHLESYYIQKLINLVDNLKYKSIVWEEVFSNGVQIPKSTVVHVWKDLWQYTLLQVTKSGHKAILSACWYLDHMEGGGDWEKFYSCEPNSFSENPLLRSLVIGGEACMWSEVVDGNNVISRVWPRASAAAEKLWYVQDDSPDMSVVRARLEEHVCRMNRRGIGAQPPNGPGFCL